LPAIVCFFCVINFKTLYSTKLPTVNTVILLIKVHGLIFFKRKILKNTRSSCRGPRPLSLFTRRVIGTYDNWANIINANISKTFKMQQKRGSHAFVGVLTLINKAWNWRLTSNQIFRTYLVTCFKSGTGIVTGIHYYTPSVFLASETAGTIHFSNKKAFSHAFFFKKF
jgi:hypothetical protein